jgi:hypothetical protein
MGSIQKNSTINNRSRWQNCKLPRLLYVCDLIRLEPSKIYTKKVIIRVCLVNVNILYFHFLKFVLVYMLTREEHYFWSEQLSCISRNNENIKRTPESIISS